MKTITTGLSVSALLLIVTGCANTTIFAEEGNKYKAISTSRTDNAALKDNIKKAEATCRKQGKSLVVVSQKKNYYGVDPNLKKMANLASDAAFFASGAFVPTTALSSDDDYKITTVFKCD